MTYQTEFPNFKGDIPPLEGFVDTSWHNDICPSFELVLEGESGMDGVALRLWIDQENPEDRESPEYSRYALDICHEDFYTPILSTDDLDLIKFVVGLISGGYDKNKKLFLCSWNDEIFELHSWGSLIKDYGDTNLFDSNDKWAMGETSFHKVLVNLLVNKSAFNQCDNMKIWRVSPSIGKE